MTQLYSVKAVPELTGCSARLPTLNGIKESAVLKLRNSSHTFYLVYTPIVNHPAKTIEVSKSFMTANGFEQGYYRVEEAHAVTDAKQVKAMVTRQDWEVIGDKRGSLESQFLGQAKLVWNNLIIPIQYSKTGMVKLKCVCEGEVMRLKEHSHIVIDIEEDGTQQKVMEHREVKLAIDTYYDELKQGHNETILVHPSYFQKKQLQPHVVYEMEDRELYPTANLKTFGCYLQSSKEHDQKKTKQKWYGKFAPLSHPTEDFEEAQASTLYSTMVSMSPKLSVKQLYSATDKNLSITNEYFISSQSKLQIFLIPVRAGFKKSEECLSHMIDMLAVQAYQSLFVNGGIYHCNGEFFIVSIEVTEKSKQGGVPALRPQSLLIKKVKDYASLPKLRVTFIEAVRKKLVICGQYLYEQNVSELDRSRINSALALFRSKEQSSKYLDDTCNIFEGLYPEEIKRVQECLSNKQHILVTSPNKNGKTFLSSYLQHRHRTQLFYIDFEEFTTDSSYRLKDILEYLELVFQCQPCTLFFDNIDAMCKLVAKDLHRQNEMVASKVFSRKLIQFVELYASSSCILVAQNHENLDEEMKLLETTNILLKNPSTQSRRKYFERLVGELESIELLRNTESMSFAQVLSVVSSSSKLAELSKAKEQKKDEQLHNFSRIAGLQVAKDTILETMEAPFKYSYLYKELPIKMPKGVLLYGPSGVGKTYLANAVKEQVRISFFEFKGSDILNMYIGASEQAVRDIFETAMSVAPSVVFFDEFESIVPKRTANNTGVTDRIVNQFLCYLDGVSSLEGVFLMAASSRPEMIDPALLRPGRIDKHVYLDYPNEQERAELLTIYQHAISFEYPTEDIVSKTVNYSYSDMVGLLKELRIKKAGVLLKQEKYEKSDFKFISKDFFDSIQKGYRLSSTPQQQAMQRRRYQLFAKGQNDSLEHQRSALK